MAPPPPPPKPDPFLTVRLHDTHLSPSLCGLCVGYENREWRVDAFSDHVVEWLPEFALSSDEWKALGHANAVAMIRKAAHTVYTTRKFQNRGEFGEILLHAIVRQVHDSIPAISKIYYKSAANDTVKGFDAVHVVGPPEEMELWLGEAKFYQDIHAAIRDVIGELRVHLQTDYLRGEFILITNKIPQSLPQGEKLKALLSPNTSLDEVFRRVCIPILLTYDSTCVANHDCCSQEYVAEFCGELHQHYASFAKQLPTMQPPAELRIHLFLLPLKEKAALVEALDRKLKAWQQL